MKAIREPESLVEFIQLQKECGEIGKNFRKKIGRFLEFKARERLIPISGYFELTPLCNLDCKMCYVHLDGEAFSSNNLLSVNTWKALIKQAHEAGMVEATLTGGECLTYPGFDDLFLFLLEKGIGVHVLSNGILIDEQRVSFFKKNRPQTIKITLYGSDEETYYNVTGHRVFNTVYHNLVLMRDSGLPVYVSITPNKYMKENMRDLIETVEDLGIPYEINSKLFTPRKATGRSAEDLTLEQYIELYRIRAEFHHHELVPMDFSELPDIGYSNAETKGLRCGAGRSSFTLKYDGNMSPCVSLDELCVSALDKDFRDAWKIINEYALNYMTPRECTRCKYLPVCIHCEAMHKNARLKGHCDRTICERTTRLAQEGFLVYHKEK